MSVCVIGAGALGSAVGGVLALDGHRVVLVTRNREHAAAIAAHGLRLDDGRAEQRVAVAAVERFEGLAAVDLAIVLVKSFDTGPAIAAAHPVIGPGTAVLTLQNGVGCEDVIAAAVGRERVIAGRTFVGGRIVEPGLVEYGVAGRQTVIGELDGSRSERIAAIAAVFTAAGMATEVTTDIVATMWDKLLVNVATGAWSALTRLPYGELSRDPDVEPMAVATVAEAMAVARAAGVAIAAVDPAEPWRAAWRGLPAGFQASMLQSVERGARTEVDVIHGAVCRAGRDVGVPTPINDTLLAAMRGLERHLRVR